MIDENITTVNKTMIIITDAKRYREMIKVYRKDVTSTDQAFTLIDQNTDQTKSHQPANIHNYEQNCVVWNLDIKS